MQQIYTEAEKGNVPLSDTVADVVADVIADVFADALWGHRPYISTAVANVTRVGFRYNLDMCHEGGGWVWFCRRRGSLQYCAKCIVIAAQSSLYVMVTATSGYELE